jgi:hypothetical protein
MSIKFLNGIDVDNGVLYTDTSNNRVGINTSNPQVPLEAKYTGTTDEIIRIVGPASGKPQLTFYNDTTLHTKIVAAGNNDFSISNTHSTGDMFFATGGATRLHIESNGNVGIGTTIPQEKLDISAGNIRLDDNRELTWATTDANVGRVRITGNESTDSISFATDNSVKMTLTNTGLGIGTTSPQGILHISSGTSGDAILIIESDTDNNNENDNPQLQFKQDGGFINAKAGLTGDAGQIFGNSLGNAAYFGHDENASVQFYTNATAALTIREDGDVGIGTTSPAEKLTVSGDANVTGKFAVGIAAVHPTIDFYNQGTAYFNGSTTVDDNLIVTNGNVGIGTTSPAEKLQLKGDATYISVIASDGSNGAKLGTDSSGDGLLQLYSDAGVNNIKLYGEAASPSYINAGNVGIGTTSPSYKLDVSGDAYIDETLNIETTISGTLQYGYSGVGAGNLVVGGLNFASFTPGVITLMNQDTSISAGQDLGVLQFGGKDDTTNGYANGQIICTTASNAGTGNSGGGIFRFLLSGNTTGSGLSERMRITNTGNVGIGTTSPSYKLDVNGVIRGEQYLRLADTGGTNQFSIRAESTYGTLDNGSKTFNYIASNHLFLVGVSEKMRINSSGNVGIGVTSPSEKLEVNGTVKASATTDAYKGYIKQNVNSYGAEKVESSNYYFTSYNTTTTVTSAQAYNRMVAAYNGRVKKVYIRHGGASTPTATAVNFKKHTNGTTSSTVYSATVANAASANMSAYYEFGNNDFTFNAGDLVGLLYQTTDAFGTVSKTMGGVAVTITLEYNIT